jgi:AcrR family transcriptional regulator
MSECDDASNGTLDDCGPSRPRGLAHKREAIMRAARVVFGRDGYSRSSIEAIAAEAGVSTRTIYNHFESKEQLFSTVLETSATRVADAFVEAAERRHSDSPDLFHYLVSLGHALAAQSTEFPEHFAMVRQIRAEAPHFPPAVLNAWREAGPLRVEREVAHRLEQLSDQGLLRFADASRAAFHFIALTTAEITSRLFFGAIPLSAEQITEIIAAGVHAFLNGYADPSARPI